MIRFRIGQNWKHEQAAPVDGFAFELDGVNLLAGAHSEPLARVVPELVDAVHALMVEGEPVAQLSLPEAHVELGFFAAGDEVELTVVSLARPARLVRPPFKVEVEELAAAAARCGRTLLGDLEAAGSTALKPARRKQLVQRLERLEDEVPERTLRTPPAGWAYEQFAHAPGSFGFKIVDPQDQLLAFDRRGNAPLVSLLFGGSVSARLGPETLWAAPIPPFLFALELSRQAADLAHALEVAEPSFAFRPGGTGTEWTVDLKGQTVTADGKRHPLPTEELIRGMVQLCLAVAGSATARSKAQARNPYLQELSQRSREVLAHLQPAKETSAGEAKPAKPKRGAKQRPLGLPGRVRRLRFEPRWEQPSLGGEGFGRLLLGPKGPIFTSSELAIGFSSKGERLFRHASPRGVAVAADGTTLVATSGQVLCFQGANPGARWLRDHDGLPLGPELFRRDGLLLTTSEGRAAVAYSEATGRELWRAVPPRTQRAHLLVQAHRVLLATDAGYLYGLDLIDGQIKYRIRAPLPFHRAPTPWGRRVLAVLSRMSQHALFAADAHSGEIVWEQELTLSRPSPALALGSRAFIAGEREGDGVLLCFGQTGKTIWERALHLGPGPYALKAMGRAILVASQSGAATLVAGDGAVEWHVGAAGDPVAAALAPVVSRGVLILPGEKVRAVDPRGGAILAEVASSAGLCDLQADARLNLYLLDEDGTLKAYRLATQLSVV